MEAWEILERAADVIDECGHFKGRVRDPNGTSVCTIGAISLAMHGEVCSPESIWDAVRPLRLALGMDPLTCDGGDIVGWNDATERTAAEVTSTMRAVAATLRAQANRSQEATLETANADQD